MSPAFPVSFARFPLGGDRTRSASARLAPPERGCSLAHRHSGGLPAGNPQFLLQIPNGLGPTPRWPPLAHPDGLVLDLWDHLDGDKDGSCLTENVPHLGAERLEIVEAIGGGIARLFRHAGVVDVLGVRHRLSAGGGVTLVVE